ncbi:MAG: oligosaccharide flippase family protein [Bacteroidales bacterium]|nr:oligosaccharide flippase family protein [Bacteroidales bacterium]
MDKGLKPKISYLLSSSFLKNSFTIFYGGFIAQLIPFIVEPFLTRIYSPSEFAVFAQFLSFTSLFAIIATARYELAIVLPKSNRKSINIVALSFIISVIVAVVLFLIVLFFRKNISLFFKNEFLQVCLWYSPFIVLLVGVYQIMNYWFLREKHFRLISIARIINSLTYSLFNLFLGFAKLKSLGLVWGYFIGQLSTVLLLISVFFKKNKRYTRLINKKEIKETAKLYIDFPTINSLHAFSDILQQSVVIFLLSYFFSSDDVGYYSRTYRLLIAPVSLIGASMGQVFFQRASVYVNDGIKLRNFVLKNLLLMISIAVPFFTILALFSPYVFEWFLGKGWSYAGEMARYMTPWLMFSFIVSPLSTLPLVLNKQKKAFIFSILGNSLIILCIFVGGKIFHDVFTSLAMVSISMSVYFVIVIAWFISISSSNKT